MHSLWLALIALGTTNPSADACASLVPPALERRLEESFPDTRLPTTTDSDGERRRYAATQGKACLLIAQADVDGDGRPDLALILPTRNADGYRLVAALNKPAGYEIRELGAWKGPVTNLYVDVAAAGTYRHTEAYPFQPSPGVVEEISSKQPGFYFGTIESAADVYFLDHGRWLLVHVMD